MESMLKNLLSTAKICSPKLKEPQNVWIALCICKVKILLVFSLPVLITAKTPVGHSIVSFLYVASHLYLPPSDTMTFNSVNTWPVKISLLGLTARSTQLVNVGWCKSLTVALGSSVVQFISIFKLRYASNTGGVGLTNVSAPTPVEKQMTISTCTVWWQVEAGAVSSLKTTRLPKKLLKVDKESAYHGHWKTILS